MPDTIQGALQLTLVAMTVVFGVLLGLGVVIRLTRRVVALFESRAAAPEGTQPEPSADTEVETEQPEPADESGLSAERVAVITAAVSAYLAQDTKSFALRRISLVPQQTAQSGWVSAGRRRQVEPWLFSRQRRR